MRNIKLIIEYDGTNYKGWQVQESKDKSQKSEIGNENNVLTIQGILQEAIKSITNEDISLIGAGRTDSGVHAKGQVANFHTQTRLSSDIMPFAINAHMPQDIAVKFAEEVPLDFNARKNAKAREYMYVIGNNKLRTAVARLYSYHIPLRLDIDAMKKGADYFKGEHDFLGFMASGDKTSGRTRVLAPTYKNIMKLDIEKKDDFIYITIKANSFLTHMVRYMVAALLEVGRGKMKPEDIKLYLEPSLKKWTHSRAPAKGLFLMKVEY